MAISQQEKKRILIFRDSDRILIFEDDIPHFPTSPIIPTSGTSMIFGHLPAGYITSKLLLKRFEKHNLVYKEFMFWGMLGSIAPDADLLYYYTIDNYHHPHHTYFTHLPFFWLPLFLSSLLWLRLHDNHSQNQAFAVIFTLGACIHMVLDTFTGNVFWLAPFFTTPFSFGPTDLEYNSWELNYFTHWAFVLELCIVWWAVILRFKKN